jgi:hypothetical protein
MLPWCTESNVNTCTSGKFILDSLREATGATEWLLGIAQYSGAQMEQRCLVAPDGFRWLFSAILARELRNAKKPSNGSRGFVQTGYLLPEASGNLQAL